MCTVTNWVVCIHNVKLDHLVFLPCRVPYLENDNFAIISLEVECPRGRDEAVGLTHYILPEPSNQSQGVQQVNPGHHSLQLKKQTQAQLSPLFFTERCVYSYRPLSACYTLIPAHAVALQTGADSDSPGCMHTAHQTGCRLPGRLRRFGGSGREQITDKRQRGG